ncbi:MAG: hypothetical protein VXX85_06635 [Candidatus Margulisiibacteriota bacterium]|nr:hypothetical protein [Candidatus Margulisiibacteriota bacterium]
MIQNDVNELLELVSPKYYQEFRRLYNELLGYLEREEYDKLDAFSKRLEGLMTRAYYAQVALHRRLKNHKKQDGIMQKMVMHNRFRNPKKTLPITHPFPIKKTITPDVDVHVEATKPVDEQPSAIGIPSKENIYADDMHSVKRQRDLAELAAAMAEYDSAQSDPVENAIPSINESTVDANLNRAVPGSAGTVMNDAPPIEEPVMADSDGQITDDLSDNDLYFKKKGQSKDVERAKSVGKKPGTASKKHEPNTESVAPPSSEDQSKNRKERIWDYIDKDQSSGGITHDL